VRPAPALALVALGCGLAGSASAQSSPPTAVAGRFVAADGPALEVVRDDPGYAVRRDERSGRGALDLERGVLTVTWPAAAPRRGLADALGQAAERTDRAAGVQDAYRLTARGGRLALVDPEGVALPRVERAGWWRLPPAVRSDLVGPFQSLHLHPDREEPFAAWFAAKYGGTPVGRRAALAEWSFGRLERPEQVSLLCLHAKMKADEVWRFVGALRWISPGSGTLLFEPTGSQDGLRRALEAREFGDWWSAGRGRPWGVRSRWRGVQLHFRGSDDPTAVNVHIDFVNPGDPPGRVTSGLEEAGLAWRHYRVDYEGWSDNHVTERVLREVRAAGYTVPLPDDS